jgi:hypothetical protein
MWRDVVILSAAKDLNAAKLRSIVSFPISTAIRCRPPIDREASLPIRNAGVPPALLNFHSLFSNFYFPILSVPM